MSARERLLKFMREETQRPMTAEELYDEFSIKKTAQQQDFHDLLQQLVTEGNLYKNNADQYGIPEKFNLIPGRIERNPKGFGFLIPDDPEQEDIYLSMENMDGAMHNDKVFVRFLPKTAGNRRGGEVVTILQRANRTVVGNLETSQNFGFVVPDNKRIFQDIFVPGSEFNDARHGQKVVVKITHWPEKNRNPEGRIIEILGFKGEQGVDIEAIIRQLGLPQKFPEEVLKEVEDIPLQVRDQEKEDRLDLRNLPMVTIDGADAKDLDDAVSLEKLEDNKVRLGIHIADVSHYVREDSPLDREALNRGTSIYLVDRVIPMLPRKLSNGICSLNPQKERLTLSVLIDYRLEPLEILDYEIAPSVIKTDYRLTYDEVRSIIVNPREEIINKYQDFVPQLKLMNKLREKLRDERFEGGSINFEFPEVKVKLDDNGKPVELEKRTQGIPEQLIEEFMIAANRIVAEDMYWREVPFIYRVHDQPDIDRMQSFNEFIHNFGYHLKGTKNKIHPGVLQELLQKVKDEPEQRIIDTVLLRTMKKAVYSEHSIGHFGLSLEFYTHFTSPIRRYPDLMIHRIIKEILAEGSLDSSRRETLEEKIPQIADHSSLQERRAMEAERDSVDLKKVEYMQDKVGYEYEGIISGIIGFGFFVELDNTVEGLVHVEDLTDDYYHFMEDQQALIGERTKNIFRLGDKVKVVVDRVNLDEKQLDFVLAE